MEPIHQEQEKEENIKELLISGGAGAICFLMGYLQGIIETVGKEELKQYKIGSVSCGTAGKNQLLFTLFVAAGFLLFTIHSEDKDMKYFYFNHIREIFHQQNRIYYGLFTNGKLIRKISRDFYRLAIEKKIQLQGVYHTVHTSFEGLFTLTKQIVDDCSNEDDFVDAIESSCNLPLICRPGIFSQYRGKRTLDGGFTASIPYKYENSQKIFINVMPQLTRKWPFVLKQPANIKCIDITENEGLLFPRDYWIWEESWADEMYLKGYLASKKHEKLIIDIFQCKKTPQLV